MLWLTWRQHRWPLITVAAILTVYWTFLVYAGLTGRQALAGCPSWQVAPDWCFDASRSVHGIYTRMNEAAWYGRLLPLVIGVFWGAPLLARELEQGTHRLAFTQSVTRRRWLAVKIGVLAGVAALFGAVTGALVAWARGQYAQMYATRPFGDQEFFASSGAVIPAAMWVAALLAGVMIGLLLRRTVAAMAVTLILLPLAAGGLGLIRPHYLPPVERLADGAQMFFDPGAPNQEQGWVLAISYLDPAGRELDREAAGAICADPSNTYPTAECLDRTGLRQRALYHPADRYPWFQLIEAGLLLAASAAMALTVWWRVVHRRG